MPRRKKKRRQSTTSSGSDSGRDAKGRFTKGHSIGHRFPPGHDGYPSKRWRRMALSLSQAGIHPEEVADLVRKLFDDAMEGDAQARETFFRVMLGKPLPMPDPEAPDPANTPAAVANHATQEYFRTRLLPFAKKCFPHLITADFSQMHSEWADERLRHYAERGLKQAIAAPRAHAKSSLLITISLAHDVAYQLETFIVVVCSTQTLATQRVKAIRDELESNAQLQEIYGSFRGEPWNQHDFTTANGVRILGISPGTQIRGLLHQGRRPTKIVLDDAEHAEHVQTQLQREKFATWYNGDLMKLGTPQTNVVMVGTILHAQSYLMQLMSNPGYRAKLYRAVEAFAPNIPLWQRWRELYSDLANPHHVEDAQAFFETHQEAMLEGSKVLWRSRLNYLELMKAKLLEGDLAFSYEYQNDPTSSDAYIFKMEDAGYFRIEPEGLRRSDGRYIPMVELSRWIAFYDPSVGGGPQSDFGCAVVLAEDTSGFKYIVDVYISQDHSSTQVEEVAALLYRWGVTTCGLESNGFQSLLSSTLKEAFAAKALTENDSTWSVLLVEVTHTRAKVVRISSLEPSITRKWLWFSDALPAEYMRQFRDFIAIPDAGHDDGPDATEAALKLLTPR